MKYKVDRNKIFVGKLIHKEKNIIIRKMLFTINQDNLADDLLYYSPNYKIDGIETEKKHDLNLIVNSALSLEKILLYLKFNENLKKSDIRKIYKILLSSEKFYLKNLDLFGMEKIEDNIFVKTNDDSFLSYDYFALHNYYLFKKEPSEINNKIKTKTRVFF